VGNNRKTGFISPRQGTNGPVAYVERGIAEKCGGKKGIVFPMVFPPKGGQGGRVGQKENYSSSRLQPKKRLTFDRLGKAH